MGQRHHLAVATLTIAQMRCQSLPLWTKTQTVGSLAFDTDLSNVNKCAVPWEGDSYDSPEPSQITKALGHGSPVPDLGDWGDGVSEGAANNSSMPRHIWIAVMGASGTGKSTFISHLVDVPVKIGHTADACELSIKLRRCYRIN